MSIVQNSNNIFYDHFENRVAFLAICPSGGEIFADFFCTKIFRKGLLYTYSGRICMRKAARVRFLLHFHAVCIFHESRPSSSSGGKRIDLILFSKKS
jgi:hypothetical protein